MGSILRVLSLLAAVLLLVCGCRTTARQSETPVSGVQFAMDTFVEQRWYGEQAQQTYDEVLVRIRDLENRLSLYRAESEISALNAAAGKHPVSVSQDTFALLSRAKELSAESGGLFDVTIAPLTLAWNITSGEPQLPSDEEIEAAKALVDYRDLILDETACTAMLAQEGMKVDLGGIGKGMAAQAVSGVPREYGATGFVSIGGNIFALGDKPNGDPVTTGVRDPRGEVNDILGAFAMDGLTMATTGDYERYFELDGVRYHHVLDPFTGYPSVTDLMSVTVISEDGVLADCLSTSIFMQGSGALERYFARDDCWVIAVTNDRQVYATPEFWEIFTVNPAKTEYTFHQN